MPEIEHCPPTGTAGVMLEFDEYYSSESTIFQKYELGKLLGCGAFAKVYHARNVVTGQSVAIKVISKQKIIKGGLTSHIKREVSIMRRLRHPNIVKLYEVLATRSKIYFAMEYVKGGELFSKVSKARRLSEDLSRRYFQQLISAIHYCHSHGVFHRDLKPENLLVDENGDLKVSDFGLSAVTDQIRSDGLLHTLCGTPAYVAPEILRKKGYDGAKIDMWSCGIILYVLNAGYLPFNDPNLMVMYRKIYKGEFRCPKWFSSDLRRFLSCLLNTNPDHRITVDEIIRDPWFTKGTHKYKQFKLYNEEAHVQEELKEDLGLACKADEGDTDQGFYLNAFDIISFSSGFDLSSLFNNSDNSIEDERFISTESPDQMFKKLEEDAKREKLTVRRKDWRLMLIGQNGNLSACIDFYRLTENLYVVDVRSYDEIWKNIRSAQKESSSLKSQQEELVSGN